MAVAAAQSQAMAQIAWLDQPSSTRDACRSCLHDPAGRRADPTVTRRVCHGRMPPFTTPVIQPQLVGSCRIVAITQGQAWASSRHSSSGSESGAQPLVSSVDTSALPDAHGHRLPGEWPMMIRCWLRRCPRSDRCQPDCCPGLSHHRETHSMQAVRLPVSDAEAVMHRKRISIARPVVAYP